MARNETPAGQRARLISSITGHMLFGPMADFCVRFTRRTGREAGFYVSYVLSDDAGHPDFLAFSRVYQGFSGPKPGMTLEPGELHKLLRKKNLGTYDPILVHTHPYYEEGYCVASMQDLRSTKGAYREFEEAIIRRIRRNAWPEIHGIRSAANEITWAFDSEIRMSPGNALPPIEIILACSGSMTTTWMHQFTKLPKHEFRGPEPEIEKLDEIARGLCADGTMRTASADYSAFGTREFNYKLRKFAE